MSREWLERRDAGERAQTAQPDTAADAPTDQQAAARTSGALVSRELGVQFTGLSVEDDQARAQRVSQWQLRRHVGGGTPVTARQ